MEFKFEFSLLEIVCFLWEAFLELCTGTVITAFICAYTNLEMTSWYGFIMIMLASVIVGQITDLVSNAVEEDDNEDGE